MHELSVYVTWNILDIYMKFLCVGHNICDIHQSKCDVHDVMHGFFFNLLFLGSPSKLIPTFYLSGSWCALFSGSITPFCSLYTPRIVAKAKISWYLTPSLFQNKSSSAASHLSLAMFPSKCTRLLVISSLHRCWALARDPDVIAVFNFLRICVPYCTVSSW
jgi:hypothetical protein